MAEIPLIKNWESFNI